MKALLFERNLPRFAASRLLSTIGSGRGAAVGPLRLTDVDTPIPPDLDWHVLRPTLSGICGSDLATIDGRTSRYFEDIVSFPFVPGHEVVGVLDGGGEDHAGTPLPPGSRAVVEPVLGCRPRSIVPE
ncbi:MAG: alcohol dehydrogenase catalytic domain-containing protein, partial [Acidimicrobiales bacterium]